MVNYIFSSISFVGFYHIFVFCGFSFLGYTHTYNNLYNYINNKKGNAAHWRNLQKKSVLNHFLKVVGKIYISSYLNV